MRLPLTRALVLHPYLKRQASEGRDAQARLEEAAGLAQAIDLTVVERLIAPLVSITPSTLLGKGKVEEIAALVAEKDIALAIIDRHVSPVQQRNLEKAWKCKVIDRTALILEIFGARARTAEGKLQVELAALNYQKTRLVRSWTHLERQRGGFGFLGGPGESQIEIDRRLIRDRIAKIKRELTDVTRTRELHRENRRRVPYPVVALVGYTNAGKSTLFNILSGANVTAQDQLFATLDPTMRAVTLPSGMKVILSDTVGFVSNLPTELIAAFRATLEEVLEADLLVHVRDIAHPDTDAQKADVEAVLRKLFGSDMLPESMIEVYNKIDMLPVDSLPLAGGGIPISALTGEGVEALVAQIGTMLSVRLYEEAEFTLPLSAGAAAAWLHRNGQVLEEENDEAGMRLRVRLTAENIARFRKRFALN